MARNFKMLHTQVGPFPKDRIVSEETLKEMRGVDIDRLLSMGAIEVTSDDASIEELPDGPEGDILPEQKYTVDELESQKVPGLKTLAQAYKIDGYNGMTKAELVQAISEAQAAVTE